MPRCANEPRATRGEQALLVRADLECHQRSHFASLRSQHIPMLNKCFVFNDEYLHPDERPGPAGESVSVRCSDNVVFCDGHALSRHQRTGPCHFLARHSMTAPWRRRSVHDSTSAVLLGGLIHREHYSKTGFARHHFQIRLRCLFQWDGLDHRCHAT